MESNNNKNIESNNNVTSDSKGVLITEVSEVTEYITPQEIIREVSKDEIEESMRELKPREGKAVLVGPNKLTRFEKARIVGARALQLSLGAPPLVVVSNNLIDSIRLAEYELDKKVLPISVRRVLPDGKYQNIPITWLLD